MKTHSLGITQVVLIQQVIVIASLVDMLEGIQHLDYPIHLLDITQVKKNTTGNYNTYIGANSGQIGRTASNNTFMGYFTGFQNSIGSQNTSIGTRAGEQNTTGNNNIFLGFEAGKRISSGGFGNLTVSNGSIFIGRDTKALLDNQSNQIVIGDSAIGLGTNTTVIGNTSSVRTHLFAKYN